MGEVELWHNSGIRAIVDPIGAWLTNLSDENGHVLYPRRNLEALDGSKKQRGGSHVCLPNFGPGGASGLPQHGHGRTSLWQVRDRSQSEVTLKLTNGADGYEALVATLTYTLSEASITMTLTAENNGSAPLRIAPGFHPYINLLDSEQQVHINDHAYELSELAGTEFVEGQQMIVQTDRRTLTFQSESLTTWAIWTDQLGSYVCCEPTFRGNAFIKHPKDDEWLQSGASRTFTTTIQW